MHTLARLREVLQYKPRKGHFVWLIKKRGYCGWICPGDVAGTKSKKPSDRLHIVFEGKQYRVHRLAFLFMTGNWPPKGFDLDHINRVPSDNRWCNLRLVTRTQNRWNTSKIRPTNKSGVTGVFWLARINKWVAGIIVHNKSIGLGWYTDFNLAVKARRAAELKYFGEYAPQ